MSYSCQQCKFAYASEDKNYLACHGLPPIVMIDPADDQPMMVDSMVEKDRPVCSLFDQRLKH